MEIAERNRDRDRDRDRDGDGDRDREPGSEPAAPGGAPPPRTECGPVLALSKHKLEHAIDLQSTQVSNSLASAVIARATRDYYEARYPGSDLRV